MAFIAKTRTFENYNTRFMFWSLVITSCIHKAIVKEPGHSYYIIHATCNNLVLFPFIV